MIKLLVLLLGPRTRLTFLHCRAGETRALRLGDQEELLEEYRRTTTDANYSGRGSPVEQRPAFPGNTPLLSSALGIIALAL